jgi:hypothetical protein
MLFFFWPPAPSDISPAVASPSLVAAVGFGAEDWISDNFDGLRLSLIIDDLRLVGSRSGCDDGAGDIGLEEGMGVDVPVGWDELRCFFLGFFRLDSFPLVSEAERLGDPARLRLLGFFN